MAGAVLHEGHVRRIGGMSAADAIVAVARGTAPTPEIAIRCDSEGRFRIALPPGRFEIEARAPDGALGKVSVETNLIVQFIEVIVGNGQ